MPAAEIGTPAGRVNLARQALRRIAGRRDPLAKAAGRRWLKVLIHNMQPLKSPHR